MPKTVRSREYFLDFLRIIACFLVIVNHTNSEIFLSQQTPCPLWFLSITYFFVSKIAVPIFFMISGYLLLGKEDSWKRVWQRILRMVIVLVVCAVLYEFYNGLYLYPGTPISQILLNILKVVGRKPSTAFWYIYAYVGILLMLPFLQKMARAMSKKDYWIFFGVTGLFTGVWPILQHYIPKAALPADFYIPLFSGYVCMLMIGQYFARFGVKKSAGRFWIAAGLFLLGLALNVGATYMEFLKNAAGYLFYDKIVYLPILLESVSVFYMATYIKCSPKVASVVSYIGACTFGIYLISDMVISFTKPLIYQGLCRFIHCFPAVVLFELIVFAIGFLLTALLRWIPGIKKYL